MAYIVYWKGENGDADGVYGSYRSKSYAQFVLGRIKVYGKPVAMAEMGAF